MKKTKKAIASLAIAGMALTMIPFNAFAAGTVPTRLAGLTAENTAVQIADQTGYTGVAILASSTSYGMVDALTAGPLAHYLKAPILLTGAGNALDAATKAELVKLAVKKVFVTSGTAVIKQSVLDELKAMGIEVVALGGFDRAATSVNIASKMVGVTKVAVANGLADALSFASIAAVANQPILLTDKDALPASVGAFLTANPTITSSDVIGGTGIISDVVTAKLPSATRHAGYTAYDTNSVIIQDFVSSLEFTNVFVASGVTGVDALAGAPLAAQTKSAIVLTDGVNVPAVAAFTFSKSTTSTVVTALGGTAVVPEAVRMGVATGNVAIGGLAIVKVSALDDSNRYLEISFSQAITPLEASDITVQNADTLARYGVKSVAMASSGLTATVELYAQEDDAQVLAYLQDYAVTVNVDGTILKSTFNRPAYTKSRILEINVEDREFTVLYSGNELTVEVPTTVNFDFYSALGREARVWFNADHDLVNIAFETETVVEAAIEFTKSDEIEDMNSGEDYDLASDVVVYLDDEEVTTTPSAIYNTGSQADREFAYSKLFFNDSGDVELVVGYSLNDFFIVKDMDGTVAISYDDDEYDFEDFVLFKAGKLISTSDLKEGDIVYFSEDANGGDGVAEVYNTSVKGEIENVYSTEIEVDGELYNYTSAKWLDGDDFETVTSDDAEAFQAGGDVTLFLNRSGDLVYLTGAQDVVVSNTVAMHLVEDIVAYNSTGIPDRGTIELEGLDENQDEQMYELNVSSLDAITNAAGVEFEVDEIPVNANGTLMGSVEVDEFQLELNGAGTADDTIVAVMKSGSDIVVVDLGGEDNQVIELSLDDNGNVEELAFFTPELLGTTDLELDDKYVKDTNGDSYRLESGTVVFDGTEGNEAGVYGPDADEITVTTWSDLEAKGFDITNAVIYPDSDGNVDYLVITDTDAEDVTATNAVITDVLRNTDNEIVRIKAWVNGVEKTFTADELSGATGSLEDTLDEGDIVIIDINDDTDVVENVTTTGAIAITGVIKVGGISLSNKTVTITVAGVDTTYELVSDGYVLDAIDPTDVSKEALRDLEELQEITVLLDEAGSRFAEGFVIITDN